MSTIKFFTLGCKVNQYETQALREKFLREGYKEIAKLEPADLYVINTCTVTHRSDSESRRLIRCAYRENPKAKIIVTGCYVELDEDRIRELPGNIQVMKNNEKEIVENIADFSGRTKAFVKIQDGCDHFCSYCKVPLVRGRSRCKPKKSIIEEIKVLVKGGFKEIVLAGICLGDWKSNRTETLPDLLEEIDKKIEGHFRIRLSSIEPRYVTEALIEKMAASKRICKHLHIPLQSGSDEILRRMNRGYSSDNYLELIRKIRNEIPNIGITTDVLIGFPGETEKDFEETLKAVEEILPAKAHIFSYSVREGTAAAKMGLTIPAKLLKIRQKKLEQLAKALSLEYRKRLIGKIAEVLVETKRDKNTQLLTGYTDTYVKTLLSGPDSLKGELAEVRISQVTDTQTLAVKLTDEKGSVPLTNEGLYAILPHNLPEGRLNIKYQKPKIKNTNQKSKLYKII